MANPSNDYPVEFSVRLYQRLLAIYPKPHRLEFGSSMAQLFRDQCRDAWIERGGRGVIRVWLRLLPDLAKTSTAEHLIILKRKLPVLERFLTSFCANPKSRITFVVVTMVVFSLTVAGGALYAFLTPNSYCGMARLNTDVARVRLPASATAEDDPNLLKILTTESVLNPVIRDFELQRKWAPKNVASSDLDLGEAYNELIRRIEIRRIPGRSLTDIRVLDRDKQTAADLANAIAASYKRQLDLVAQVENALKLRINAEQAAQLPSHVLIVDLAQPPRSPVWPNRPLMIFMAIAWGIPLALIFGTASALLALRLSRRSP